MSELFEMTAGELVAAMKSGKVGVEELTDYYIKRIKKYGGAKCLNAVSELNRSAIVQAAALDSDAGNRELPLYGLPVLVKDNIDVAGLHTTAGSLALADNIAADDARVIANLRRKGAVILGKTNMTEFANYTTQNMPGGYSSGGGQVKNAYDRTKDPSGSSSGSAVAMSAGLCAAAVGTDTSFSVIGCATVNGVAGLKPPHGSLSVDGIVPIAHTLDSAGPLTRCLSDAILVYSGMRDEPYRSVAPANPHELRIAVNTHNGDLVSERQHALYGDLFGRLKEAGVSMCEISQPHTPYQRDIMRCEFGHDLEQYLAKSNAKLKTLTEIVDFYESNPRKMMKYGDTYLRAALDEATGKLDDEPYLKAMAEREPMRERAIDEIGSYDACVMTGPTNIMHFVGMPSVALKLCMGDDGMPRGIILYGADEARLYSAALTVERYCLPVSAPKLPE